MSVSVSGLLVLVVAGVVSAQTKFCCTPLQWESVNYIKQAQVESGNPKPIWTEGTELTSVDGVNHKIASMATLQSAGLNITVQTIQLFDQHVMYQISSGECKQSTLGDWAQPCIPDNSTLLKQSYYGVGDNKVDVDIYGTQVGPNMAYTTMARADCTPVAVSAYGASGDISAMSVKTYTNVTMGIKDTSIFIVPSICSNATRVNEEYRKVHPLF